MASKECIEPSPSTTCEFDTVKVVDCSGDSTPTKFPAVAGTDTDTPSPAGSSTDTSWGTTATTMAVVGGVYVVGGVVAMARR